MTTELIAKANRLVELRKRLAKYQAELKELRELENSFNPETLAIIEAMSAKQAKNGSAGGQPNESIRKWLADNIFSGNKKLKPQKVDQTTKLKCQTELKAQDQKITTADVSAALAYYCTNYKVKGAKGKSSQWEATDKLFAS